MNRKIPWWLPETGPHEYPLIQEVLASNYVNEGSVTEELERRIAALLHVKYAIMVTSGTAAITLALLGLGVQPGDEVIVPDITFIATANAAVLAGARPVLADVNPRTLNIDPEAHLPGYHSSYARHRPGTRQRAGRGHGSGDADRRIPRPGGGGRCGGGFPYPFTAASIWGPSGMPAVSRFRPIRRSLPDRAAPC